MLDWLRKLLFGSNQPEPTTPISTSVAPSVREPTGAEIAIVEKALADLAQVGITLGPMYDGMSQREVANEIATNGDVFEGFGDSPENASATSWPLLVLWQARDDAYAGFRNAALIQDHSFDVADEREIEGVLGEVLGLSGLWEVGSITATNADDPAARIAFGRPVRVVIEAEPSLAPFTITHGKDFDWTLLDRLSEQRPTGSRGRYLLLHDGGSALVVFLRDDQIERFRALLEFEGDEG